MKRLRIRGDVDPFVVLGLFMTFCGFVLLTWGNIPFVFRHALIGMACGVLILAAAFVFSVVVVMGAYEEVTIGRKMTDPEEKVAFGFGMLYTFLIFAHGVAAYIHWAKHTKFFDV